VAADGDAHIYEVPVTPAMEAVMAVQAIGSTPSVNLQTARPVTPAAAGGGTSASPASSSSSTASSSFVDSTTIVSSTTTTNADGSVTTTVTYKDGHKSVTTSPPTIPNQAGELRSTNNNVGRLFNIVL
jgi:hypothetical protein